MCHSFGAETGRSTSAIGAFADGVRFARSRAMRNQWTFHSTAARLHTSPRDLVAIDLGSRAEFGDPGSHEPRAPFSLCLFDPFTDVCGRRVGSESRVRVVLADSGSPLPFQACSTKKDPRQGVVRHVQLVRQHPLSCKVSTDASGKSRGHGFVHYETEEAAKQAIERVNNMQIGDKQVEVTSFKKRAERETAIVFTNLYVKNLPDDFDEEKLAVMFGGYGTITSSCILEDKAGRKFCFVNFETPESAQKAVEELNGKDLRTEEQKSEAKEDDKPEDYLLYVGRAQSKAERAREFREKTASSGASGRSPTC